MRSAARRIQCRHVRGRTASSTATIDRTDRRVTVHPWHHARRSLPHRRPCRPRRDGRGVPSRRFSGSVNPWRSSSCPRTWRRTPINWRDSTRRCALRARCRIRTCAACTTSRRRRAAMAATRRASVSFRWSTWTAKIWRRCCAGLAGCRQTKRSNWPANSAPGFPRRTIAACFTGISNRPTSSSTGADACGLPTSVSPDWPKSGAIATSSLAHRATWPRSNTPARARRRGLTSTRSVSCSMRCSRERPPSARSTPSASRGRAIPHLRRARQP